MAHTGAAVLHHGADAPDIGVAVPRLLEGIADNGLGGPHRERTSLVSRRPSLSKGRLGFTRERLSLTIPLVDLTSSLVISTGGLIPFLDALTLSEEPPSTRVAPLIPLAALPPSG